MPRGGLESSQLMALKELLDNVILSGQRDRWCWCIEGSGEFSVASARKFIDSKILVTDQSSTRWNKLVPIKVNVFMWRLGLNKVPTTDNLDKRGIDVHFLLCPICELKVESVDHLFFVCQMARDIWKKIGQWWGVDIPKLNTISELNVWMDSLRLQKVGCLV